MYKGFSDTTLTVRAASAADVGAIISLIGKVWAEYDCVLDAGRDEPYLLTADNYFHERSGEFWVVEDAGHLIATGAVMLTNSATAELKSLYVAPAARGRGLGSTLTQMALDLARQRGALEMELWSDTRFTDAHRLYERLGFRQDGTRQLDDINNTSEYRYRIDLT